MKRTRKGLVLFAALLAALMTLTGCFKVTAVPVEDFSDSPFKHINNGGLTDDETLPYNIDAITGATMTVEGPGMITSIPLSVREIENRSEGQFRGIYKDSTGKFMYEGLDVYYLLNGMSEGDNGIVLTETAQVVQFKDSNRATIAEMEISEIEKAHEAGTPVILAYGIGTEDGETVAPFVFDAKADGEHSLGYVDELENDDGCVKLVYDLSNTKNNLKYKTFTNVAYIYICEKTEPGFKHADSAVEAFRSPKYTQRLLTVSGAALGAEFNFTLEELENLVVYDSKGNVKEGGIGYSDYYCLANNAYWYVNEYEGLELYDFLQYLGMETYEEMGRSKARTTYAKFLAADGRESTESFNIESLAYPDAFGFYNKNAADPGDGTYMPTAADLVDTGYPVLLAYGVNNYPYTISKLDDGYLSGLSNGGGPLRIVFGKTQYNHANGSNQVQQVSHITVGDPVNYAAHAYTTDEDLAAYKDSSIAIRVLNPDGSVLMNKMMTVAEIEALVYGEAVDAATKSNTQRKGLYQAPEGDKLVTDVYEGVDMEMFLMDTLGLPGTSGKITFKGDTETAVQLSEVFAKGYNPERGVEGLSAIIAYAKNGAALAPDENAAGYVDVRALQPFLDSDPKEYRVDNAGGPLAVLIPSATAEEKGTAKAVHNLKEIVIELEPDSYAHLSGEEAAYQTSKIKFYGPGLYNEKTMTVAEIEARQRTAKTMDYSVLNKKGELKQERYRGVNLYDLFTEIGIKSNAGNVIVHAADGSKTELSLALVKKSYENFADASKPALYAMLAYGQGDAAAAADSKGAPLTSETGGPIKLVVPMETAESANSGLCVKNVTAIEVTANKIETWGHSMSDIYAEFLPYTMTLTVKNDTQEKSIDITVEELEKLEGMIVRDTYSVLDIGTCEGIDLWKLVEISAAGTENLDNPVSVTVYASDGYKNDLLSVFYMDGLTKGVVDGNGDRKKLIIAYAFNGYPLVDEETHEGYTGIAGNTSGPLRIVAETVQGASVKYFAKLVVTLPGSGNIELSLK